MRGVGISTNLSHTLSPAAMGFVDKRIYPSDILRKMDELLFPIFMSIYERMMYT
jgi:hypothetical protein